MTLGARFLGLLGLVLGPLCVFFGAIRLVLRVLVVCFWCSRGASLGLEWLVFIVALKSCFL